MIELKSYGMNSHQGPHLNLNEDYVEVDLVNNLFMVIDGFGGSNIGDKAALMIRDTLKRSYTKIANDPDSTLPFFFSHKYLIEGNALINALHVAHQNISRENESKSINSRGGGSVLSAAMAENILTLVSTGNCGAYLYRKGHLTCEILPDSLRSLSRDRFTSYLHTVPMSGVGLFEDLHYQVKELKISGGDIVILLTDGVYARLEESEIKYTVEKNLESELEIIKELFKLANDRGNLDNQTALILQF
ncbi:MAG: SpoIIE family protein phosphatase [Bacteriovorax sp.]|nr:SpoIIE family protein phosphatase [Bacteriovorax sp.]